MAQVIAKTIHTKSNIIDFLYNVFMSVNNSTIMGESGPPVSKYLRIDVKIYL